MDYFPRSGMFGGVFPRIVVRIVVLSQTTLEVVGLANVAFASRKTLDYVHCEAHELLGQGSNLRPSG